MITEGGNNNSLYPRREDSVRIRRFLDWKPFDPIVKQLCADLRTIGVEAHYVENPDRQGREIDITRSPIHWINMTFSISDSPPDTVEYCIPDSRHIPRINLHSKEIKTRPLLGRTIDIRWQGDDKGTGIAKLLSSDGSIKNTIMNTCEVTVKGDPQHACWLIIYERWRSLSITSQQWRCYEKIAESLLATPLKPLISSNFPSMGGV